MLVLSSNSLAEVPVGPVFIIVGIVMVFYLWTQYRQKMELIKKGDSIVNIDSLEEMKRNHLSKGIIAISLSLGILFGTLLEEFTSLSSWVAYPTMLFLFFGLGALVFYGLVKDK